MGFKVTAIPIVPRGMIMMNVEDYRLLQAKLGANLPVVDVVKESEDEEASVASGGVNAEQAVAGLDVSPGRTVR